MVLDGVAGSGLQKMFVSANSQPALRAADNPHHVTSELNQTSGVPPSQKLASESDRCL